MLILAISLLFLLFQPRPSSGASLDAELLSSLERALYCQDREPPTLPVLAMSPKRYAQLAAFVRWFNKHPVCDRNREHYFDIHDEFSWPFCVFGYCYEGQCKCVHPFTGHNCAIYSDKCWILYCFITSCNPAHQSLHCNCHPELYGQPVKTMDYWYDDGLRRKYIPPPPDWQDEVTGTRWNAPGMMYNNDVNNLGISKEGIHTWEAPMFANRGKIVVNTDSYEAPVNLDSFEAPVNLDSFVAPQVIDSFQKPTRLNSQGKGPVQNSNIALNNNPYRTETGRLSSVKEIPDHTSMTAGQSRLQNANFQNAKPVLGGDDMEEAQESFPGRTSLTAGQQRQPNTNLANLKPVMSDYEEEYQESFPDGTSLTAGQPKPKNTIHGNSKPALNNNQAISSGRTSLMARQPRPNSLKLQNRKIEDEMDDEDEEDVKEAMDELEEGGAGYLTTCNKYMYYAVIVLYVFLWF